MKVWFILLLAVVALIATFMVAPVPQDLTYHLFADQRELQGVPNFWNVLSNLPFIFVGFAGLWLLLTQRPPGEVAELCMAYLIFSRVWHW
jgi:hypothetical protein